MVLGEITTDSSSLFFFIIYQEVPCSDPGEIIDPTSLIRGRIQSPGAPIAYDLMAFFKEQVAHLEVE